MESILFPYDNIRETQAELITSIKSCIKNKDNLIIHAPTGLGKTAASLPVALKHAIDNELKVFFLTSRHTQHKIAIDTLKDIKKKYKINFSAVDLIGKRLMCNSPSVGSLSTKEFIQFCRNDKENNKCKQYSNTKKMGSLLPKAFATYAKLKSIGVSDNEYVYTECANKDICPYEISLTLAKTAQVVICDYFHIFNEDIRDNLFTKIDTKLSDCIIIIDEGHNLPSRIRDLMSHDLTLPILKLAADEAKKQTLMGTWGHLKRLIDVLKYYEMELGSREEVLVRREDFIHDVNEIKEYDSLIHELYISGELVLKKNYQSLIIEVAAFLEKWKNDDEEYIRVLSKKTNGDKQVLTLSYRCLDPSLISERLIKKSYSTILMSGTLFPTKMYKDLLGFPTKTGCQDFESPFPKENRLSLIVPKTSTKFTKRSQDMYKEIGKVCSDITNLVPGNSAIFFPSYYLQNQVFDYFFNSSDKTSFREAPGTSQGEKLKLLEKFKNCKSEGAVLHGVSAGSYGEGIDLPGDLLKCVIVVGLPLQKPDLVTRELIRYYDHRFSKGWDYGYLYPAFNRILQSAGRCIRSEKDKGIVVFLDERYAWDNYKKCFPDDYEIEISKDYQEKVKEFLSN